MFSQVELLEVRLMCLRAEVHLIYSQVELLEVHCVFSTEKVQAALK